MHCAALLTVGYLITLGQVPPPLIKVPTNFGEGTMENTPVVFNGRPLLVQNVRPPKGRSEEMFLIIDDIPTGREVARFGQGYSFASAFVKGAELNVFGTEYTDDDWTHDIYRFSSTDLKTWKRALVLSREGAQHFFNASVCRDEQGYLMAYESNVPVQWSFMFARSTDLAYWEKLEGVTFADLEDKGMSACPALRYVAPYYYVIYTIARRSKIGRSFQYDRDEARYVAILARSRDLATWELSPSEHPLLEPALGEGLNNSDVDLFEYEGRTYVFYATGDQASWGTIRIAMYPGPMRAFFEGRFPKHTPMIRFDAKNGRYIYP